MGAEACLDIGPPRISEKPLDDYRMVHEQVVGAELNMRHLTQGTKCSPIGNGKDGRNVAGIAA